MELVAEDIDNYRQDQKNTGEDQRGELAFSMGLERGAITSVPKFLQTDSSSVRGCSTIGAWRVSSSHTAPQFDAETLNFIGMDVSRMMASGSGSGPGANRKIFSFNRQRPFGVKVQDVSPTDRDLFDGVNDDDSFIKEGNFWANQKNVNGEGNENGNATAGGFSGAPTLVETGPEEKGAQYKTDAREDHIGVRTVSVDVGHCSIITYQASDIVKAVQ
jgi:hypothetical protein